MPGERVGRRGVPVETIERRLQERQTRAAEREQSGGRSPAQQRDQGERAALEKRLEQRTGSAASNASDRPTEKASNSPDTFTPPPTKREGSSTATASTAPLAAAPAPRRTTAPTSEASIEQLVLQANQAENKEASIQAFYQLGLRNAAGATPRRDNQVELAFLLGLSKRSSVPESVLRSNGIANVSNLALDIRVSLGRNLEDGPLRSLIRQSVTALDSGIVFTSSPRIDLLTTRPFIPGAVLAQWYDNSGSSLLREELLLRIVEHPDCPTSVIERAATFRTYPAVVDAASVRLAIRKLEEQNPQASSPSPVVSSPAVSSSAQSTEELMRFATPNPSSDASIEANYLLGLRKVDNSGLEANSVFLLGRARSTEASLEFNPRFWAQFSIKDLPLDVRVALINNPTISDGYRAEVRASLVSALTRYIAPTNLSSEDIRCIPDISPDILESRYALMLRNDNSVDRPLVIALAQHPNCPTRLLQNIVKLRDSSVRSMAQSRLVIRQLQERQAIAANQAAASSRKTQENQLLAAQRAKTQGESLTLNNRSVSYFRQDNQVLTVDKSRVDESSAAYREMKTAIANGQPGGLNGALSAPNGATRLAGPMDYAGRSPLLTALKRGRAGAFYAELQSNPRFRRVCDEFNDFFRQPAEQKGTGIDEDLFDALQKADPVAFTTLLQRMEEDTIAASNHLSASIGAAQRQGVFPYYPTIIVGSGPQGASIATEWKRTDPRAGLLVIDSATRPGGQFVGQGSQFRLNSRSGTTRLGENPAFGSDIDLNPIAGPVQPAGGARYATADAIANAARAAAMSNGADVLLDTGVATVVDQQQQREAGKVPGRYLVLTSDGNKIYTDQLIVAGGIGKDKFPFDNNTNLLIEQSRAQAGPGKPLPGIVTVSDLLSHMESAPTGRDAMRAKANSKPVTLYVGAGDSTFTALENVYGFGPESAYTGAGRVDYTQRGIDVGQAVWFTGPNGFSSCDEFARGTDSRKGRRSRYAAIEGLLQPSAPGATPKVSPMRAELTSIRPMSDGRYAVTYKTFDSNGQISSSQMVVDRVVLGTGKDTGVESTLAPVLSKTSGNTLREKTEEVMGTPDGYRTREGAPRQVAVANKVRGQDVYLVGPTLPVAPTEANVTADQSQALDKARENVVGLAYNTPRNVVLARDLATKQKNDPTKQTAFIATPQRERTAAEFDVAGQHGVTLELPTDPQPLRMLSNSLDEVRIASALRLALARLSVERTPTVNLASMSAGGATSPTVRVWAETIPGTRKVELRVSGLNDAGAKAVLATLQQDAWLMRYLAASVTAAERNKAPQSLLALSAPVVLSLQKTLAPTSIETLVANPRNPRWSEFRAAFAAAK